MKAERRCESCGVLFYRMPSVFKHSKGRFCSRRCVGIGFTGEKSSLWKGGIRKDGKYLSSSEGMIHRVVAEKALEKPLPPDAVVHHHDEDGTNYSNPNLVICENRAYHNLIHARMDIFNLGGDPGLVKWCGTCKSLVGRLLFHKSKNSGDGLRSECKPCGLARNRPWIREKRRKLRNLRNRNGDI